MTSSSTALISIHPEHVAHILSGEKRIEFRRTWAARPVRRILIYSTAPEQRLVGVAAIKNTVRETPRALWAYAKPHGPGITLEHLLKYFTGKKTGVALHLSGVRRLKKPLALHELLPRESRPPQSFRYLTSVEERKLQNLISP
jgi:predicted transcriptional regulator